MFITVVLRRIRDSNRQHRNVWVSFFRK